jgi:predicted nucleic acid-binding protein
MFILDTNVVSELRKAKTGKADRNVLAWASSVSSGSLFLSAITVLELETGVLQKERSDLAHGSLLRAWLDGHVLPAFQGRVLAVDMAVVLRCAKLHIRDPSAERDALIAATAIVHGMTVVTRNTSDFVATGVSLLNPWVSNDVVPH